MSDDVPPVHPGDQRSLRRQNDTRVLECVAGSERVHQAEISRATGLSRGAVSGIVRDLEARGIVETIAVGRRRVVILARRPGFVLGIDHGHRHVRVALADLDREILDQEEAEVPDRSDADTVLTTARGVVDTLLERTGIDREEIASAAIGLPTPIDIDEGVTASSTILPGWPGRNVAAHVAEVLDVHVPWHVDNDANLGVRAEFRARADKGIRSMAYIKFGAGLGAGIVLGGRLMRGVNGTAGEIGHLVFDPSGPLCRCGNRGCLETLVSVPVITGELVRTHGVVTIAEIVELADAGDVGCRRTLHDAGALMGRAVAVLANLMNPDIVVIGGELEQAAEYVLPAIAERMARECIPVAASTVRLTRTIHGRATHVIGAVHAAVDLKSAVPTFRM